MKKQLFGILSNLFPSIMANLAYKALTSPQIKKLRVHELEVLDQSIRETLAFKDFQIQVYHWKAGADTVLLIHGWEGQAGNFSDLIVRLLEQNISVIAFDGPSHGFSSKGRTSLFEFTELVGVMVRKYQVRKLVSHSFGGVATTYALSQNTDLEIDRYALLTTPDRFVDRIEMVARQVGITRKVQDRLMRRLEEEIDLDPASLNVSNFVQKLKVQKALIIHDRADRVIPIAQSRNVHRNWPVCTFQEIEGTGHFRILRTPAVIEKVVTFLQQ